MFVGFYFCYTLTSNNILYNFSSPEENHLKFTHMVRRQVKFDFRLLTIFSIMELAPLI